MRKPFVAAKVGSMRGTSLFKPSHQQCQGEVYGEGVAKSVFLGEADFGI